MVDGGNAYFIHSSNNHRIPPIKPNGLSLYAYLFETVYLLFWYGWFSICCFLIQPLPATGKTACESFGQYVRRIWLPEVFLSDYLLPLMSSVATCTHENLLGFPAIDLIDYKRRTSGAEHYVVSDGVHEVQRKLSKALDIRLSARVVSVKPNAHGIQLRWRDANSSSTTDVSEDFFDRVVLAVSPDVVGSIFEPLQYEMAQIPTTLVRNLVHTDGNMPGMCFKTKCSQAQVIHFRTTTGPNARTEALHVQPSGTLVTTCPLSPVCPSKIIREFEFTRVLRSPTSRKIINNIYKSTSMSREPFDGAGDKRSQWRNGDEGVFIVGGWCWDGMVLLEGCVVSAMKVADAFGVDIPWRNRRF
ncbi:hypothetical protein MMC28_000553 [Mycoblastus sanguinarius]|nr:hypothetical protein [Mycoblastus sanguinarius]